ncbi:MAG: UpxY family transcription antiterminator [Bacteroidaceae bacterium]|nr:UpxY family transcription antiterminator [Bacteroidaceae bacterium]
MINSSRLFVLRNIISNQRIVSQEQLLALLKDRGYEITQPTLSRYLQAIHAHKVEDESGAKVYVLQETDRYIRIPRSVAKRNEEKHWYVMLVRANYEKRTAEALTEKGIENWVPVQTVRRRWSDRIKIMQALVITKIVFVHCTEIQRRKESFITGMTMSYLMDRTVNLPATVPEFQLEAFREMIAKSEQPVEFTEELLRPGELVEIVRGNLAGQIAEICKINGNDKVILRLNGLGSAITSIALTDVAPISKDTKR